MCAKPAKTEHASAQFKSELDAAKEIVKKCKKAQDKLKSKSAEKVELEHTEDLAKELKTSVEKNLKSCQALKALTDGGMDETEIERLATAARERAAKNSEAEDVN